MKKKWNNSTQKQYRKKRITGKNIIENNIGQQY